jgi:cytochrome c oxidase cbb3-type subunit III
MCSRYLEVALWAAVLLAMHGCERENRRFEDAVPPPPGVSAIRQSDLQLGPVQQASTQGSPYLYNAHAINQGKQLFEWFNCNGCHAQGGGAIGPALMDDRWVYGAAPENIFATIVEGRPNGMPSFRGRIPTQQVWQLVAYVQSMSGQASKDASPSRSDHLFTKKSEQSGPDQRPVQSSPQPPVP